MAKNHYPISLLSVIASKNVASFLTPIMVPGRPVQLQISSYLIE